MTLDDAGAWHARRHAVSWDAEAPQGLARIGREITRQAAVIADINAFGLFTLVAAAAIPFALLLKRAQPTAPLAR